MRFDYNDFEDFRVLKLTFRERKKRDFSAQNKLCDNYMSMIQLFNALNAKDVIIKKPVN